MSSVLSPSSFVLTWTLGPIHVLCTVGFFLLRRRPFFAIRVPELVLGSMLWKFVGFALFAWLLLDPECPCVVLTFALWIDVVGNYYNILRKFVLLFRFELQAALVNIKEDPLAKLSSENIYVRYSYLLRTKWQYALMAICFLYSGLPKVIVLLTFFDQAIESQPCLTSRFDANGFVLWSMILIIWDFVQLMPASIWTSYKLKAFPKDNWKLGSEGSISSAAGGLLGLAMMITACFQPFVDKLAFQFLCTSAVLQLLCFFVPWKFHHDRVIQFSKMDLKLSSLARLLQDATFFKAFHAFLKTEFSSESLYFWQEMNGIQSKYKFTALPSDESPSSSSFSSSSGTPRAQERATKVRKRRESVEEDGTSLVVSAAKDCIALGQQCIGAAAPWQINISATLESNIEATISRLSEFLETDASEEKIESVLKPLVEDVVGLMMQAQKEIYELLRKDPYPRFVQSSAFAELNKNERLKMSLAAEIIEEEVRGKAGSLAPAANLKSDTLQVVVDDRGPNRPSITLTIWNRALTQLGSREAQEPTRSKGSTGNREAQEPTRSKGSTAGYPTDGEGSRCSVDITVDSFSSNPVTAVSVPPSPSNL